MSADKEITASEMSEPNVLIFGAALVDQIATVPVSFLVANGLEQNATYHCNKEPRLYAVCEKFVKEFRHQLQEQPGGSPSNTAYQYHNLSLSESKSIKN